MIITQLRICVTQKQNRQQKGATDSLRQLKLPLLNSYPLPVSSKYRSDANISY